MRTILAMVALALAASACSSNPNPVTDTDGGNPMTDAVVTPTDAVVTPTDTGTPTEDNPVIPADTMTAPTSTNLPPGRNYSAPGGNDNVPCADRLGGIWGFPTGERPLYDGVRDGMRSLNIGLGPMVREDWTWSEFSAGMGYYWNNAGNMMTEIHCRLRIMDATRCDRFEIQCFAAGVDPDRGGTPMPDGTIVSGRIRGL